MAITVHFSLFLLCDLAPASPSALENRLSSPKNETMTIFFQNDGNWTAHAERPSALFVDTRAGFEAAVAFCEFNNETLLSCEDYPRFSQQFVYQQYLGVITSDQKFWSTCRSVHGTRGSGTISTTWNEPDLILPFLCTNTAPFVSSVDIDYSKFPRVTTTSQNGTTFTGVRNHMAFQFMGVPYAVPPTGSRRFQHAQDFNATSIEATSFKSACMQFGYFEGNDDGLNPWGNSEDCLYLNVWTPHVPSGKEPSDLKPVMVWIHGGGESQGTGSDPTFVGDSLVSRGDVVLVTLNYRLNVFGLLALNDGVVTGNYALSDQISALRWIQRHIRAFGGDPTRVTVFGQSAGGGFTVDLSTSPKTSGLMNNAIVQSGGRGGASTAADVAEAQLPLVEQYCNSTGNERLECLQRIPAPVLLNLTQSGLGGQNVIDGDFLVDFPVSQASKGPDNVIPINYLTGFMPEESQTLMGTTFQPNVSIFAHVIQSLTSTGGLSEEQGAAIMASGVWNITIYYTDLLWPVCIQWEVGSEKWRERS